MNVIIDLCIIPLGVGVSLSPYMTRCQEVQEASGLNFSMHAYGTNMEGSWDDVMAAVKSCHQTLHDEGVPRMTTTMKLGTRVDRTQTMQNKVDSVLDKLPPKV